MGYIPITYDGPNAEFYDQPNKEYDGNVISSMFYAGQAGTDMTLVGTACTLLGVLVTGSAEAEAATLLDGSGGDTICLVGAPADESRYAILRHPITCTKGLRIELGGTGKWTVFYGPYETKKRLR